MQFNPHDTKSGKMKFILRSQSARAARARKVAFLFVLCLTATVSAAFFLGRSASAQNDQPQVGPGIPQVGSNAPKSAAGNTKAGSVLFLPKYTSDNANPSATNTLISLTNTNPRDGATVRVFFVRNCQVQSSFITLAANQTRTLLAGSEDPGKTGYVVAVATNAQGLPTQFNWLIGSASIVEAGGHEAMYKAVAAAKRTGGAVTVAEGAVNAELKFNDVEYDRLPQMIALDQIQNQDPAAASAVRTDVAVISPPADLNGGTQALKFAAIAYDQSGRPYPQILDATCGLSTSVSNIWTAPALGSFITPTRPGWGSFAAQIEGTPVPVIGVSFTDGIGEAQRNARQMQTLSRLDSFSMKLPIVVPPVSANESATSNLPDATGNSLGASEMKAGSVLAFSRFTSGTYGNSQLAITNTHPTQKARLRLFFTGLADATVMAEAIISLFPNQTTTINPGDFAPNQKGWMLAVAIDARALPIKFNFLIGSARVKEQGGAAFGYNALALAKNSSGSVPRNEDVLTSDLKFDDENYDRLPSTLALAGLPSQVDNTTTLGYARPPVSVLDAVNTRGSMLATVYDELLAQTSATIGGTEVRLGTVKGSATAPPITNTILKGRRGWLKVSPGSPVFPWVTNAANAPFVTQSGSSNWTGGMNGGGTLHILAAANTSLLRVTSTNPNNLAPTANFETIPINTEARATNGTIVRFDGRSSSDPNPDDPLTYQWFDNDKQVSTAAVSDFRLSVGSHVIKLIVTDGSALASEPLQRVVDVADTMPPIMSGVPSKITRITGSNVGSTVSYPLPYAYDAVDGLVTVTSSRSASYLFPIGISSVTFTARDSAGNEATATMQVEIKKGTGTFPQTGGVAANKLPAMNSLNDQYVIVGKPRIISLQAGDGDNDAVTFTLIGAPAYARIDEADPVARKAKLVIAPQQGDQAVATNVRLVLTDSKGGSYQTLPFRIQISDVENDETGSGSGPGGGGGDGDGDGGGG
ncbi:MAG TPA: HYR domain-containing protein, partial [Blastocatellia bacterium]|nr:HYR domain-containing protein [Blastocatellia bacterium]